MFSLERSIFKGKHPSRGWNGGLNRINRYLNCAIANGVMTKTDKEAYESIRHQYYRWFNDSDLPPVCRANGYKKHNMKCEQGRFSDGEEYLEYRLESMIKKLLKKYRKKFTRKQYRETIKKNSI